MSNRRWIAAIVWATTIVGFGGPARALDYFLDWRFTDTVGTPPAWWNPELHRADSLVYNRQTGDLAYRPAEARTWNPPDLASRSGQFDTDKTFAPVPLVAAVPLDAPYYPRFEVDVALNEQVVPGSEAIRIGYDSLQFWPSRVDAPWVLANWGLTSVPAEYDFGAVLPPALSAEFLEQDLYSTDRFFNVLVVPEPGAAGMIAVVLTAAARWRRGIAPLTPEAA